MNKTTLPALRFSLAVIILLTLGACDLFVSEDARIQKATALRA